MIIGFWDVNMLRNGWLVFLNGGFKGNFLIFYLIFLVIVLIFFLWLGYIFKFWNEFWRLIDFYNINVFILLIYFK